MTKNTHTHSNSSTGLFHQRHTPSQHSQQVQRPDAKAHTTSQTEILLAAILQELKTQNMIELIKLQAEKDKEQEEIELAEKMQTEDKERFERVRSSMYL